MAEVTQNIPAHNEPSSFKLIITLGIAGFLSGIILVASFLYTKPIIAANKAEALRLAIYEVLPHTKSFLVLTLDGEGLRLATEAEEKGDALIYMGQDAAGETTGFAIPGEEPGYQDLIRVLYGYHPVEKKIIGLKVLDSKETPGLGDKIYKDADFQQNFLSLTVHPSIEVIKKGEKAKDNQMEAITGATISSKTIGRLLNSSMAQWQSAIDNYLATSKQTNHEP